MTTEERVTEVEQRAKSNSHRIDEMQSDLKNLTELTASVKVLATKQENVESDVREIKTDVKALTEKPGKRWDAIVAAGRRAATRGGRRRGGRDGHCRGPRRLGAGPCGTGMI
jgi:predicted ribosome quality control (RQC) complex YloA/Tae2 family protein